MDISSTSFLCAVRWVDNKVVTVLSNHSSHEPLQICKRYDQKEKNRVNLDQSNLIHKYNKYMGGVDQLDGFLNNLRPCIGRKKWYWTQLINLCRLLQIAFLCIYNKLHPELKLSRLEFLRSLVKQYIQNHRAIVATPEIALHIVEMETNGHYLMSTSQGRCNYYKKNTAKKCKKCNVRLHEICFLLYHP